MSKSIVTDLLFLWQTGRGRASSDFRNGRQGTERKGRSESAGLQ